MEPTTTTTTPSPISLTAPLGSTLGRRRLLALVGGTVAAVVAGGRLASATTPDGGTAAACVEQPEETGGPFPGDGSNGPDILTQQGAIRSDIRSNLDGSNTQAGAPMTLQLTVTENCVPLPGAAVYVWHCNRDGDYSMYGSNADQTWLRGVQVADDAGALTFTTILPGRYSGRASHVHFRVYRDATLAEELLTSQMAFDDDTADALYTAADGYDDSLTNATHNATDNVFSDGVDTQLLTLTGDPTTAIVGTLQIGV